MASVGTTQINQVGGVDLGGSSATGAPSMNLTPDKYTTLDALINTTKDFVLPELVQSYGDQGITGFLRLTGAVNNGGTSDQIDWWEAGRRHRVVSMSLASPGSDATGAFAIAADGTDATAADPASSKFLQDNDVVMNTTNGEKYIVTDARSDADVVTMAQRHLVQLTIKTLPLTSLFWVTCMPKELISLIVSWMRSLLDTETHS